jgi:hypothetical protein
MSNDFKKVSVLDDRLMTTDSLNYGVFRGGQNVTNVRMPAISATPNALNFVVPFPSESTILDREVYIQTTTRYYLEFVSNLPGIPWFPPAGATNSVTQGTNIGYRCPLIYGYNISIASFPTQRSMDTIQVQLNNNINTINCADVLPALLRCSDALDWEKQNQTASSVDRLASPDDEFASVYNNNMSSYDLVQGNKSIGNGSFQADLIPLTGLPANPNGDLTPFIFDYNANNVTAEAGTRFFCLEYTSNEPLLAPPFIWNKTQSNRMGIYGLQNFSVVCNYGNLQKSIKYAPRSLYQGILQPNPPAPQTAGLVNGSFENFITAGSVQAYNYGGPSPNGFGLPFISSFTQSILNAELQLKYITPHGTDVKPLRNVIPLLEYPRFISSTFSASDNTSVIPSATFAQNPLGFEIIVPSAPQVLNSQTYSLNQVPDKLIIFVRPNTNLRADPTYNDFVLPILNIVIQWNNHAGILANASQQQLFHMSKEAGSNQDWLQFSGVANTMIGRAVGTEANWLASLPVSVQIGTPPVTQIISQIGRPSLVVGQPNNAFWTACGESVQVPTIGSYLMLDMAKHLELQEPYYAPGSLGAFQLQFNVTVQNYNDVGINPEIVVIPVNSGIMVTEKGQTSCYTGILTKSDVLDASLQEPYGQMEIKRIVGHGHGDSSMALPKKMHPKMKNKTHVMPDGSRMDNRLM